MTDPAPDCGYTDAELAQMDAVDANPGPNCVTPWEPSVPPPHVGSYKVVRIIPARPRSWREAVFIAWGVDIFVWQIPLLKLFIALTLALNALFWWLLS